MRERRTPSTMISETSFCAGCGHGIVNRLIGEVLDELGLTDKTLGALCVGCSCTITGSFGIDWVQSPHGRASAVATGLKRCRPNNIVMVYSGDGDALSIGLAETVHAALRNENITVIVVNNGVFGMTGGQMTPTTLPGQKTTTSPMGRDPITTGYPLGICELLKDQCRGYIARGSVTSVAHCNTLKKYLTKAFQAQLEGRYAFVEVLSPCPTNWRMTSEASLKHVDEAMALYYPLGEFTKAESAKEQHHA